MSSETANTAPMDELGRDSSTGIGSHAWILEIFLVVTIIGLTMLLHVVPTQKMMILNVYFLPVVLAAFFLGRYQAGVLALLSIIAASLATILYISNYAMVASPMVIGLSVTVWAVVLGLTALLVGTLSDERVG